MKDAEDEAFDELARRQGAWGGGYRAKRAAAADKVQEPDLIPQDKLFVCGQMGANVTRVTVQPAQEQWNEDGWRKVNWRCSHGWLRGEQCEICHAPPAPKRTWVGLTDDELADIWYKESLDWMEFARAHEAALKEKNNGT